MSVSKISPMKKTNIALIKKEFHSAGGLEKVSQRILNAFLKKGIDVAVYTASNVSLPCPTFSYKPKGLLKVQKLKDFNQWLSRSTSDYRTIFSMDRCSKQTHHRAGNGVHAAYLDLRAQIEGPVKRLSFTLNPLHRLQLQLEKQTFESPETRCIIVNSGMVQQQILKYYKTDPSKIHVVHNGVEWKELEADFNDSMAHRKKYAVELGLDPSAFQFLFVGHNFKRKGLDTLLEALSLLHNKNFHLSVVGHDKNIDTYKMLTSRLGLESQVTFFGPDPCIRPYYLASDSLVIPSLYDPFANVTVEALALGLFVVSSKMNGGHEVLQSHSGVIIENSHSPEELAAALETALDNPKEPLLAAQIRSTVSHLDYSKQLEKICDLCIG
jgi:UDP-glucose:(heptosyl)LPS alpha-1,3-glucosyltransferase